MSDLARSLLRRWSAMDAEYQRHVSTWRSCFEATYPERADGLQGDTIDAQSAQKKKADLLDSTGADAARLLTSSIVSGTTPANAVWFALDVGDETDDERRWLADAATRVWEAIHGANYDSAKFECVLDSVCAGWFVMFIDEDRDTGALQFSQWPLSQCRISSSKPGGRVDTVLRRFRLTAEQAMVAYGDKCSDKIKRDAQDKPDQKHEFLLAIYPRTKWAPRSFVGRDLPIASVHIEVGEQSIVRESGYHESPVVVPRWTLLPGSDYAIGPVSNALPTIRQLNKLLELEAVALGRAAAGVYVAEDDGVLNPRSVRVRGGSVIVANSINSIKELPSGADFNVTFSKADTLRAEIRRLMMADQLQPQDGPAMTATEVHVRVALIRQLLGPLFGRLQAEDLAPTIERCLGLMFRRGRPEIGGMPGPVLISDPPPSLGDVQYHVRYQSPLARAQKADDVTAAERIIAMAGMLAQVGKPEALDLIDAEQTMRIAGDGMGAPDKMLRSEDALQVFRDTRAKAQAQQQQSEQQQQISTMAADAAFKRAANA